MPSYDPSVVLSLTARRGTPAQQATLMAGMTLAHLAAAELSGAEEFPLIAQQNGILDPIPFFGPPPRHLRRGRLTYGDRIDLPDGDLL